VTAAIAGIDTPRLDQLAIVFLVARICQTLTHTLFHESNFTVGIHFTFFAIQVHSYAMDGGDHHANRLGLVLAHATRRP